MRKKVINIEMDYNFKLIGIVAPIRDYRMCFQLNNLLNTNLQVETNNSSFNDDFCRYTYRDELLRMNLYLLNNRNGSEYLIPEHNEIDFFLIIKGPQADDQIKEILEKIKHMPIVQIAFEVDINELRSKQNLLIP